MIQKKAVWNLLKETFTAWNDDRAPRLAAALAYYTIFALAPLLIIAIAVAAFFFDAMVGFAAGLFLGRRL